MFKLFAFRVFEALLLDAVLELSEDRLVPDENDEPSEIMELGRCVLLVFSAIIVPENEFRNFGAAIQNEKYINFNFRKYYEEMNTFFELRETD